MEKKIFKKNRKPIIALAPIKYFDISKKNNLQVIKKYIRLAKKSKADIVCFPESCIHKTENLDYNDDLIKEIRKECKKNSIWCIITENIILKNKPYNTAILIARNGKIKGKYKKIHLYGDDVVAGKKVKVFDTDFAKIGIVIC
jgi:predicted amidohydrolase